jgi:hypothetical protein
MVSCLLFTQFTDYKLTPDCSGTQLPIPRFCYVLEMIWIQESTCVKCVNNTNADLQHYHSENYFGTVPENMSHNLRETMNNTVNLPLRTDRYVNLKTLSNIIISNALKKIVHQNDQNRRNEN